MQYLAEDLGIDGCKIILGGNYETFKYPKVQGRKWQEALANYVKLLTVAPHTSVDTGFELFANMFTTDDTGCQSDMWLPLATEKNIKNLRKVSRRNHSNLEG